MEKDTSLGAVNPYTSPHIHSIQTYRGGDFEYSPEFLTSGGNCTAATQITMSGSRATDRTHFKNVNIDPSGRDWRDYQYHHTYSFNNVSRQASTCDAQMVLSTAHTATFRHTGAAWQFKQVYAGTYRTPLINFLSDAAYSQGMSETIFVEEDKKASIKDIDYFEFRYMVKIPGWLSDVFRGKTGLLANWKTADGYVETLEEIVPLNSEDDEQFTARFILDVPVVKKIFKDYFPDTQVIPFATDPCGNLFVCADNQTYFYDHEEDAVFGITAL